MTDVTSCRNYFKTAAESVEKQILREYVRSGGKKQKTSIKGENTGLRHEGRQPKSFQQNLENIPVGREETFVQTYLLSHVEKFSALSFRGNFWKSGRETPNSWQCLVVAGTRISSHFIIRRKLLRVWISTGSELLRWIETDLFGFDIGICQRLWLRNLQNQRS